MHFSLPLTASAAIFVSSTLALQLPYLSLLSRRADITPGSPLYNCHEACGEVILVSQTTDYCSNSTYTTDLSSCLDCALTYNIWQYYGDDVKAAAKACSDDATPSASSSTAASTAAATAATATATGSVTSSSSSIVAETTSSTVTSTNTATGTAASAATSAGAASMTEHNAIFGIAMGVSVWALSL
ncbi:uncharacterized protein N7511_001067 [Penicillium nucicola]|uniref:uncharacterized protein n=1 Tax=Penicillium nucicola TaxID=1850975 RepID=UPI0025458FFF|nr:uncharacterized protein N7511_001067 [Penicillium nucicola]KAJ5776056.1 hypothetical protein N7511_001067 [Penicillium nucicola]